jgi:hypothetical protein
MIAACGMLRVVAREVPWIRLSTTAAAATNAATAPHTHTTGRTNISHINSTSGNITGNIPAAGQGVAVHQVAELERCFTESDVRQFGLLIQDLNPLHDTCFSGNSSSCDDEEQSSVEHQHHPQQHHPLLLQDSEKILVHGLLVGSLFSSIFGTLMPGRAVYVKQSFQFRQPVYTHQRVRGRVTITRATELPPSRGGGGVLLTCGCQVLRVGSRNSNSRNINNNNSSSGHPPQQHATEEEECVRGQAQVWILGGYIKTDEDDTGDAHATTSHV